MPCGPTVVPRHPSRRARRGARPLRPWVAATTRAWGGRGSCEWSERDRWETERHGSPAARCGRCQRLLVPGVVRSSPRRSSHGGRTVVGPCPATTVAFGGEVHPTVGDLGANYAQDLELSALQRRGLVRGSGPARVRPAVRGTLVVPGAAGERPGSATRWVGAGAHCRGIGRVDSPT